MPYAPTERYDFSPLVRGAAMFGAGVGDAIQGGMERDKEAKQLRGLLKGYGAQEVDALGLGELREQAAMYGARFQEEKRKAQMQEDMARLAVLRGQGDQIAALNKANEELRNAIAEMGKAKKTDEKPPALPAVPDAGGKSLSESFGVGYDLPAPEPASPVSALLNVPTAASAPSRARSLQDVILTNPGAVNSPNFDNLAKVWNTLNPQPQQDPLALIRAAGMNPTGMTVNKDGTTSFTGASPKPDAWNLKPGQVVEFANGTKGLATSPNSVQIAAGEKGETVVVSVDDFGQMTTRFVGPITSLDRINAQLQQMGLPPVAGAGGAAATQPASETPVVSGKTKSGATFRVVNDGGVDLNEPQSGNSAAESGNPAPLSGNRAAPAQPRVGQRSLGERLDYGLNRLMTGPTDAERQAATMQAYQRDKQAILTAGFTPEQKQALLRQLFQRYGFVE